MPSYCTECGARRSEGQAFCTRCAKRFDDNAVTKNEPAVEPSGHGTGWYVGLSVVLALIVIGGIVGGAAAFNHRQTSANGGISIDVFPTQSDDRRTTEAPVPPETVLPTETFLPTDPESAVPTSSDPPSPYPGDSTTTPPAPQYTGNATVAVAAEAAVNPSSRAIVALLTKYFVAINQRDYSAYRQLHTRAERAKMSETEFLNGFRTTQDDQVLLRQLGIAQDGRLLAMVDFVSTQDAADGPDGQTCTQWSVGKFVEKEGKTLRFGKALPGYSTYAAC